MGRPFVLRCLQRRVTPPRRLAACAARSAFCLASRSSPVAWSTTFIDRRTLPRSSKPSSLTFTLSPSLTTSVILLHAVRRELADVDEAVLGAEEVHEGAEVHHLDHGALVDRGRLRIGGDRLDPVDRRLDRLAVGGGDLHRAVVLDVDLGAGLLDDLADHLAAGADHFADLVGRDLEHLDARGVLAELGARRGQRLRHLAEDVQAAVLGLARARPS